MFLPLEGLLSQRESEFDEIDLKLKEKSKFCQSLTEQLAEGRSQTNQLKIDNETMVSRITELEQKLAEKSVSLSPSTEPKPAETSKTVKSGEDSDELKSENSYLKKKISTLENNLKSSGKSYEQKIKNLKKEFSKVTRELNSFKKGVSQTIVEVRDRSNSTATNATEVDVIEKV